MGEFIVRRPNTSAEWGMVDDLLGDYLSWVAVASGAGDLTTLQPKIVDERADLAGFFGRPGHTLVAAWWGARPVAMAGVVPTDDRSTAELVRVYVRPDRRGRDLGRRVVLAALDDARRFGYRSVVLETSERFMHAAIALYERLGFERVDRPAAIDFDGIVSFRRRLDVDARSERVVPVSA